MNERIETNFEELKEYEKIESYYDYLEQAEHFFRDVFGDRVESQKYIVRANKEIERLNHLLEDIKIHLESYDYDNMSLDARVLARNVSLIINGTIKVVRGEENE